MENIKKYQTEILELRLEYEKYQSELLESEIDYKQLLTRIRNGHENKYGPTGDISLSRLGLDFIVTDYDKKVKQLENQITNEFIKAIGSIANSIGKVKEEIPLIDYNIPFAFVEDSGMNSVQPTGEDKLFFYFLTKQFIAFHELESIILTEVGFFNQADVILKNGKAPYLMMIKNAKHKLKYYNLIEKNGNITALGRGVKDNFKIKLEKGEKMSNEINGKFSINELIILLFQIPDQKDREDWIVAFDFESKLEGNLKLLRDTHLKWLESIGY
jgi:hypothetical protein